MPTIVSKPPRSHQQEALSALATTLQANARATAIMACGTGKTLVELWAAQALAPRRTLVLVPTLNLLAQVYREWREQNAWGEDFHALCVCSDAGIGALDDDEVQLRAEDLDFPTCTDPNVVNDFLDQVAGRAGASGVVFCTYQSAAVVGAALAGRPPGDQAVDVGIFDEAHKTVGEADKAFAYALDDKNIQITKRLFFTATPRVVDASRNRDLDGDLVVASMDDEAVYGPHAYTLSFAEAARRKIIVPYKIVISVVDSSAVTSDAIEASTVLADGARIDAATVANQIALRRTMDDYGLTKAITFHSTIDGARQFALAASEVPGASLEDFERLHVSGRQSGAERHATMLRFQDAERGIVSNAKCLTEGVDVPSVDLVAFMDPKKSKIDIVQAAGRAMRPAGPEKTHGYILLPLHLNVQLGESVQEALKRSDFRQISDVLTALAENDEALHDVIRDAKVQYGMDGGQARQLNLPGIEVRIGQGGYGAGGLSASDLVAAVETRLIGEMGNGRVSWDVWVGRLKAYKEEFGDCEMPRSYKTRDGFALGTWCADQRHEAKNLGYPRERHEVLEALGFRFEAKDTWPERIEMMKGFKAVHGHCDVPRYYKTPDGWALGAWCSTQRQKAKNPGYSYERREEMEALGFKFQALDSWPERVGQFKSFKAEHGHCNVPAAYKTDDGFALGAWYFNQRQRAKNPAYPAERRAELKALGVRLVEQDAWPERVALLVAFKARHGHCDVPQSYKTKEDFALGLWCSNQRQRSKKPGYLAERRAELESLGFRFEDKDTWPERIEQLKVFKVEHGHCNVPFRYKTPDGFILGRWCRVQRDKAKKSDYSPGRRADLEALGFVFEIWAEVWATRIGQLKAFKLEHGHCEVPQGYRTKDGIDLGSWATTQRMESRILGYPPERRTQMEALGFRFEEKDTWPERIEMMKGFKAEQGHCDVPDRYKTLDGFALGKWSASQRQAAKKSSYPVERRGELEALGFRFENGPRTFSTNPDLAANEPWRASAKPDPKDDGDSDDQPRYAVSRGS